MLDKPISPLRQRMIDDMTARRFNEHTQRDYVRNVRMFAAFLGRSPDPAAKEDGSVRNFVRGAIIAPMEGEYGDQEGHAGRSFGWPRPEGCVFEGRSFR